MSACALTGHRVLPSFFDEEKLAEFFERLVRAGYDVFYCGMAEGFDLAALECLARLKGKYPLHLVACIPYRGQEMGFCERDRRKYRRLIRACDETVVLSERYYAGCFFARNRYMVDKADLLAAFCSRETGGTAYTVRYAQRNHVEVVFFK